MRERRRSACAKEFSPSNRERMRQGKGGRPAGLDSMLEYAALRADRSKRYTHLKIVLGELVIGKSTDDSSTRDWVEGLKATRDWALVHEWFGR